MTYKENITAILECYFTGFKKEIIDSACNRILEQEPSGDLISREDTLTAFADYVGSGMSMNDYEALSNIVAKMPSVKQEPCEDAISRQAVLDLAKKGILVLNGNYESVCKAINELPPVNSRPKTGHWIEHPKGIYAHLVCSNCLSNAPYDCCTNYCPNCGSKMRRGKKIYVHIS